MSLKVYFLNLSYTKTASVFRATKNAAKMKSLLKQQHVRKTLMQIKTGGIRNVIQTCFVFLAYVPCDIHNEHLRKTIARVQSHAKYSPPLQY